MGKKLYKLSEDDTIMMILSYNPSSSKPEIIKHMKNLPSECEIDYSAKGISKVIKKLESDNSIKGRIDGKKNDLVYDLTKYGKYNLDGHLISIADRYKGTDYSILGKILFNLQMGDTIVPSTA
jgi:hypothetical protein